MTRHDRTDDARIAALAASRALLAVTAVAVAAGAVVAACAPAPRPGGPTPLASPSQTEIDRVLRTAGATGPAHEVWVWNPRWVDGDPGAEPLLRAAEWVATTGDPGTPDGTVTVWQDPAGGGEVTRAAADDDATLAAALAGAAGAAGTTVTLVRDRSDWLLVTEDRVRSLLPPPRTDVVGEVTVTGYRDVLVRRAQDAAGDDTVGG